MPHTFPYTHPLYRAAEEIDAAGAARNLMRKVGVRPLKELEDSWALFLTHIERFWNKLTVACRGAKGWQRIESEVNKLRKQDPLLCYAHHARNAVEHTIQDFTADWKGPVEVTNRTATSFTTSVPVFDRKLLPILDRGQIYLPAREHLGNSFEHELGKGMTEPVVVAEYILHFYYNLLVRAKREVSWRAAG